MSYRILQGDVIDRLCGLPAESVHCVVTSPPYFGLRDYGTAVWEGGDANCDHKQEAPRFNGPKQTQAQVSEQPIVFWFERYEGEAARG